MENLEEATEKNVLDIQLLLDFLIKKSKFQYKIKEDTWLFLFKNKTVTYLHKETSEKDVLFEEKPDEEDEDYLYKTILQDKDEQWAVYEMK